MRDEVVSAAMPMLERPRRSEIFFIDVPASKPRPAQACRQSSS